MKTNFFKKMLCIGLVITTLLGVSMTSHAAQGSVYGYVNLNLVWTTSATGASATLRSGTSAMLAVNVEGDLYSGNTKIDEFGDSKLEMYSAFATCADNWSVGTIKNGYAGGIRGLSEGISATIYN